MNRDREPLFEGLAKAGWALIFFALPIYGVLVFGGWLKEMIEWLT